MSQAFREPASRKKVQQIGELSQNTGRPSLLVGSPDSVQAVIDPKDAAESAGRGACDAAGLAREGSGATSDLCRKCEMSARRSSFQRT